MTPSCNRTAWTLATVGLLLFGGLLVAFAQAGPLSHGVRLEPKFQSKNGFPGQTVAFSYTITNTGNGSDEYHLFSSAPPPGWTAEFVPSRVSLDAGRSANVSFLVGIPSSGNASAQRFILTAESVHDNLTRDSAVAEVHVGAAPPPAKPDLVVDDIEASGKLEPGHKVRFLAQYHNQGNGSTSEFTVRFLLDGNLSLGDHRVKGLGSGEHDEVRSDAWDASAGNHTVRVILDVGGEVNESNEANNQRSEGFAVGGPAPAPGSGLHLSPQNQSQRVLPGGMAIYNFTLRNNGTRTVTAILNHTRPPSGWNASLTADEIALAPGESARFSLLVRAPILPLRSLAATISVSAQAREDPSLHDQARTTTTILV